jgi:ABC-type nitrate/sulfonate/bicarbonate transport system substrate-binding protein
MKKSTGIVLGVLALLTLAWFFRDRFAGKVDPVKPTKQHVRIGIQNSPSNALVFIAKSMNLFDTSLVDVEIVEFSAGKLALQALLGKAGDLDVAVSAETPVTLALLSGASQLRILTGVVDARNECRVVVRKDGELLTPELYFSKPRKLATSQGGSPEWLTYNFIERYKLDRSRLEILAMLPENMPIALKEGSIDGISIFDPYARIAEQDLGERGMTFLNADASSFYVLSTTQTVLDKKRAGIMALLTGLRAAQEVVRKDASKSKQLVLDQTKLDLALIEATWSNYSFQVGLTPAFFETCDRQARWAIETGKYPPTTTIPDFRSYADSLTAIAISN